MKKISLKILTSLSFFLILFSANLSLAGYSLTASPLTFFNNQTSKSHDLRTLLNEGKKTNDYIQKFESENLKKTSEVWNGVGFSLEYLVTTSPESFDPKIYWGNLLTSYFLSSLPIKNVFKKSNSTGGEHSPIEASSLIPEIQFSIQAINKGATTLVWNF